MNRFFRITESAGYRSGAVLGVTGIAIVAVTVLVPPSVAQAVPAVVSVCGHGCSYSQVSSAVAAAPAGATIDVHAGTYSGGFAITKSVTVIGAGAGRTAIQGGGPVLTIGTFGASREPTVAISGITVSGGVTHHSSIKPSLALGGGIFIPPGVDPNPGATLTLTDSVITHNSVRAIQTEDADIPCPSADCQFALAVGGGIDSWGNLTVEHSTISGNVVTGLSSDSDGGGIGAQRGALVLNNSVVIGNQAIASTPNGRYAEGGGVMVDTFGGDPDTASLAISGSTIEHNSAIVNSNLPVTAGGDLIDMNANGGGIHVGDGIPTTIRTTAINDNTTAAIDLNGEPYGVNGAMTVNDSPLTVTNTTMDGNTTITLAKTSADVGASGAAVEMDGPATITGSHVDHNISVMTSPDGLASVYGGVAVFNFNGDPKPVTISGTTINDNITTAVSKTGQAVATGGGVFNNSLLTLTGVQVSNNKLQAFAPSGSAQGGGIWNGVNLSGPPVQLSLQDSTITGNAITSLGTISKQGGGLYTTEPVTISHTQINSNQPDQCHGCN